MAANTNPLFILTPKIAWSGNITAANTAKDGTGTTLLIATAGADGAFIQKVVAKPAGTNTTSVGRLFLNNGSTPGTATNNMFFGEIDLPGTTISEVGSMAIVERALNLPLPAGYRIYVCIATAVAAGWNFCAVGGDY